MLFLSSVAINIIDKSAILRGFIQANGRAFVVEQSLAFCLDGSAAFAPPPQNSLCDSLFLVL